MKIRYKHNFDEEWTIGDSKDFLKQLTNLADTYEVRLICTHDDIFVGDGIRVCKSCKEQLEITSYRD